METIFGKPRNIVENVISRQSASDYKRQMDSLKSRAVTEAEIKFLSEADGIRTEYLQRVAKMTKNAWKSTVKWDEYNSENSRNGR